MNYRHAYHAGSFADVFKHMVLLRLLDYLKQKDKPFFVLDTHAGVGRYDTQGDEAAKTGEAAAGIGRLWHRHDAPAAVESYLAAVRGLTNGRRPGELRLYPGSPLLVRTHLRPDDRMVANELHPGDNRALRATLGDDPRVRVTQVDGYQALRAELPPRERRGLVLVDPPFEARDEFDRLAQGVADAWRRWPTGMYALWYPVKGVAAADAFLASLRVLAPTKLLVAELLLRPPTGVTFDGSGLALLNPPWTLADELATAGPWLAEAFGGDALYRVRTTG